MISRVPVIRAVRLYRVKRERAKNRAILWTYRQSVLAGIGNMTILWASIERYLDHLIGWYHPQGGADRIQGDLPISLKGKLAYLNKLTRDERLLPEVRATLQGFKAEIKRLSVFRHDLLHGIVYHQDWRTLDWGVQRVEFDGPISRIINKTYSNDDLNRIQSEMSALGSVMSSFIAILTGLTPPAESTATASSR